MNTQEHNEIIDLMIERPTTIKIGGRSFSICPLTLAKTLILQRYVGLLEINEDILSKNSIIALLEVCERNRDVVCHFVAVYITNERKHLLDDTYINELSEFVGKELDDTELATLLEMYFKITPLSRYTKILGIDRERERLRKIQKAKDESSSVQVGGVTMFGSLIDAACERYKWTYQYVLWGVSYQALQIMMSDIVQSVYLNEKEMKKARISTDGINLSGDSQQQIDVLKNLIKQ